MELGARVTRSRQAAAAETSRFQPEVASVLLHHHVSRDFRRTEHAVHARVDAHRFVDPVAAERMTFVDGPAGLELDERQPVWRVPVDLVGAGEDEGRVGAVPPHHFEHNERAVGVHGEVGDRLARGPVMRGLRRGMDHQRDRSRVGGKDALHGGLIPDVGIHDGDNRARCFPASCAATPCCRLRRRNTGASRCRRRRRQSPGQRRTVWLRSQSGRMRR